MTLLISLLMFFCVFRHVFTHTGELIVMHEPSYCAIDEYFNVNQLKCITCDSEKELIPSSNGLTCVCNERSKLVSTNKSTFPVCKECGPNSVPTKDGLDCISCPVQNLAVNGNETFCQHFRCPPDHASLERWPNGSLSDRILCIRCRNGTKVSPDGSRCLPCREREKECSCSSNQRLVDGVCVGSELLKDWPEEKDTFSVTFKNGKKVLSQFLKDNLLRAVAFCKMKHQQSCQLAGNLCAMMMYSEEEKSSPCAVFREYKRIPTSSVESVPWIFYGEGEAAVVLNRKRISAQYNLDINSEISYLNLSGVIHNLNGEFIGVKRISGSRLQLCPATWKALDSSLRFASKYSHVCRLTAQQLLHNAKLEFIDIFLHYKDIEGDILYAIPVLVKNMKINGESVNARSDSSQWQFVRRFFLVDNVIGVAYDEDGGSRKSAPEVVRYLKSAVLHVKLQGSEDEGKIFVPYLALDYGELTREEIERDAAVTLSFDVEYEMENSLSHALEVCMGVFSALAVVWSSIRTWSHSKRSGRATIDLFTLGQLLLFTCGNLANVFFLTVFCASLCTFVFFKGQSVIHVLLPREDQETTIKIYIIVAFVLKIVETCHLIYSQITVDIFFIDWERPRARNLVSRTVSNGTPGAEMDEQQPVSIWRTYFVANEWNEIQTKRKLNINIHLLITVLLLKCIGIEHWTTTDPEIHFEVLENSVGKTSCFVCRFAVGGLVFLTVYVVQWIFMALIYERYIKNGIQEFVDVCSMANISVFILALENYGFYIHGRSAHGFADTDMQNIINQLHREEEDLVGHRGLLPGNDQQTFEMIVPTQLRAYYRKVMAPLRSVGQPGKRVTGNQSKSSKFGMENFDRSVQAYHNMNRFLAAFLEHALKDLDYEVREKMFSESFLGMEFTESHDKGVLYSDNGHSFDNVLFYGNEFTLLTFDVMLFCFVEAISHDYLIAGICTAGVAHLLSMIRDLGGRKNLAKKTLIDERFLI